MDIFYFIIRAILHPIETVAFDFRRASMAGPPTDARVFRAASFDFVFFSRSPDAKYLLHVVSVARSVRTTVCLLSYGCVRACVRLLARHGTVFSTLHHRKLGHCERRTKRNHFYPPIRSALRVLSRFDIVS